MMYAFHVSTRDTRRSILSRGLLARYARGKRQAVWVACPADLWWALGHVGAKPHARGKSLDVYRVNVKGLALKRHSSRALWFSGDIPPERLELVSVQVKGVRL